MLPLPLPLIRVLDLTTSLAGASASRVLADLGAEVIVVERPGGSRDAMARFGRNKFSCVIDATSQSAPDLVLRLAAGCNVVLKDGSDETLATLDYETLRSARDDIVVALITDGSERPGVGNVTACAVMTALFYVRFRGRGQQVTVAFSTAGTSMRTAPVVAASAGALQLTPDLSASGCYDCRDGKLALVVRSIEELAGLGEVVGRVDLVSATSGGQELREVVAAWAAQRAAHDAAAELREHGIPAQPLLTREGLRDDPHLRARGVFETVAAGNGVFETDGPRIQFSDTPLHTRFATPAAGQHTGYLLRDIAGLTENEIDALAAAGVVSGVALGAE